MRAIAIAALVLGMTAPLTARAQSADGTDRECLSLAAPRVLMERLRPETGLLPAGWRVMAVAAGDREARVDLVDAAGSPVALRVAAPRARPATSWSVVASPRSPQADDLARDLAKDLVGTAARGLAVACNDPSGHGAAGASSPVAAGGLGYAPRWVALGGSLVVIGLVAVAFLTAVMGLRKRRALPGRAP
jgi:hypothetical protein